ncbi:1,4-beta-xylanase [Mycolicibacterium komossense]|uniref:1,4-beta-xylanase n=1 Tax=Mycolicibacterium komossense TaxID=1779 RepID=UPI003F49603F
MQVPRASADTGRWSTDRVHRWYRAQGRLVGANFITSNSVNQLEMFQPGTWDPRRIDSELRVAGLVGLNTVRVFLHDQLWTQDRAGFQLRLAQFVGCAARYGIKPLFVFFDSCWSPLPRLGPQPPPRPGVHNSGWVQSPGAERLGDRRYIATMRDYVLGVMRQFRSDSRVLGWDLWNEPDNPADVYRMVERPDKPELVAGLLPQVFEWARTVNPIQPLTSAVWQGEWSDPRRRSVISSIQLDNSDVVTFHSYAEPAGFEARIAELAPLGRPMICTEYMARPLGSTVAGIVPIAHRHNVGAYNWGLVAGKTQTFLPWDSWDHPYLLPPKEWFHDLLLPDGKPYQNEEVNTIRRLTATSVRPGPGRPPGPDWRLRRGSRLPR